MARLVHIIAADGRVVHVDDVQHIRWYATRPPAPAGFRMAAVNRLGQSVGLEDVETGVQAEELARQYGFTELERNWNGTIRAWRPKGGAA